MGVKVVSSIIGWNCGPEKDICTSEGASIRRLEKIAWWWASGRAPNIIWVISKMGGACGMYEKMQGFGG
jgi:hypothetical protein